MLLKDNHLFLSSAQDMVEICKPLIGLGLHYFSYTRSYTDGQRIYLMTTPHVLKDYFSKKFYASGNTESHPSGYQSQMIFWSTLPKQHVFANLRNLGVAHGMFLIEAKEKYCEFYGFGAHTENHNAINNYLNNLEFFKNFPLYFKDQAKHLLKQSKKSKITLPFSQDIVTFNATKKLNFERSLAIKNQLALSLSKRQLECAYLLSQGKTSKEIAEEMGLSSRTVEDHINVLKRKFSCRNKLELIIKLLQ